MMRNVTGVKASALVAMRSQFAVVGPVLWLIQILSTALFQMWFFVLVSDFAGDPAAGPAYVALGNAVSSLTYAAVYGVTMAAGSEKHIGTMASILGTPTRMYYVFLGKGAYQSVIGLFTVTVSLLLSSWLFGVDLSGADPLTLATVLVVTCFAMVGFGMVIGSVGVYLRSSMVLGSIVLYLGLLLCGVNFPIAYLPRWLQPASYAFPLTYGVEAVRRVAMGAGLADVSHLLIVMLAMGAAFYVLAYLLFEVFERLALRRGSLDMF
ncbi:MAG TPA: ABC transporter permease [Methanomassiliicoccales archaeon]|nr:ABC transporter permease [Methanomassiliicoccales archaeon]HQM66839.1 ABC transporter permease [Methanomassiliicoccales archaeon]